MSARSRSPTGLAKSMPSRSWRASCSALPPWPPLLLPARAGASDCSGATLTHAAQVQLTPVARQASAGELHRLNLEFFTQTRTSMLIW